jgi:monoamine oxidase
VHQIKDFMAYVEGFLPALSLREPWRHPQAAELDAMTLADKVNERRYSPRVSHFLQVFAQTILSADPTKVSFFFFLTYLLGGGGFEALGDGEQGAQKWKLAGGAQLMSQGLANDLHALGAAFLWGAPVVRAVTRPTHVELHLASGRAVAAAAVIFAVSPLLLTPEYVTFEPPLPAPKQRLCAAFIRPSCIKVFALYDQPFWLRTDGDGHGSSSRSSSRSGGGGGAVRGGESFTALGPVHNIFHAQLDAHTFALVGLITGAEASALSGQAQLRKLVLQQYARMYGADALSPRAFLHKDWAEEEFSGGCFASLLPPHTLSVVGEWLRQPYQRFFWASTETAEMYCGYFEGAILSGQRAARDVLTSGLTNRPRL